jgi:hypothetical protein
VVAGQCRQYPSPSVVSLVAALRRALLWGAQRQVQRVRADKVGLIESSSDGVVGDDSERRNSGPQYRTPQQVHDEYLEQQAAAWISLNPLSGKLGSRSPRGQTG